MQYIKSYFVIGPDGTGKEHFSKHLAEITKLSTVKLSDFETLPPLADLEKWIQNPGQYSITYTKNELETMIKLRKAHLNVKNLHELGYDKETELELLNTYGIKAASFYKKQFQNKLLEQLMESIETDAVIQLDADFPINFDQDFENLVEQIKKRPEAERLNKYFPHMDYIGSKVTDRIMNKVKNRVYLPLPVNQANLSKDAKAKRSTNDLYVSTGQYEKYSTITINTDDFHSESGFPNYSEIERGAAIAQKAAQDDFDKRPELPQKEKKDKPKKKSFFGKLLRGFLWLIPITWVVNAIQKARVKKALEKTDKMPDVPTPKQEPPKQDPSKQGTAPQQSTTAPQQQSGTSQQQTTAPQQQSSSSSQSTSQQSGTSQPSSSSGQSGTPSQSSSGQSSSSSQSSSGQTSSSQGSSTQAPSQQKQDDPPTSYAGEDNDSYAEPEPVIGEVPPEDEDEYGQGGPSY